MPKMVLVFHWNRRLLQYKLICFVISIFLLIHTFEVFYHLFHPCIESEPIDVVYTWVNGSDPQFLKDLVYYSNKYERNEVDSSKQRFDDKDELKYSLRSIEKYAPWVRHVYIITNGQIPHWLNLDYKKVTLVTHDEIFEDKFNLPTFSSPAIEAHLHRIPGLSKRFIYFNDDIFLQSPVYIDDFISPNRGFLIYLAWLIPMCAPDCSWLYVADGQCDKVCNNFKCQMDGGDCDDNSKAIIGDVIVKFDDYETKSDFNNTASNLNLIENLHHNRQNLSDFIAKHNRKVLLIDKLNRKKIKKKTRFNIDAYAESLQHTNRILNDFYGFSVRKVPAHAPILIDKEIIEKMQKKFEKFIHITARNKIRSADDLQFAFSYYYYLIHEKNTLSVEEIFDEFDTDKSGIWSDIEIRTVITKLYDLPITDEVLGHFANIIMNCSNNNALSMLVISKEFVKNCKALTTGLGSKHKYKFELIKDAEKKFVWFKMINSNVSQVLNHLDEVRKNVKKFVCLNDNLDHRSSTDNKIIKRVLSDFYQSLFPNSSQFELDEHYRNRFSHINDYHHFIKNQNLKLLFLCMILTVVFVVLFLDYFRKILCELTEKCFY